MSGTDGGMDEATTCSGRWVSGSGGHRVHAPCANKAIENEDDCYSYCEAHDIDAAEMRGRLWGRAEFLTSALECLEDCGKMGSANLLREHFGVKR